MESSLTPRQLVYAHFAQFCRKHEIKLMGTSLFGRMVHAAMPHLKSNRLGRRNDTRYYYMNLKQRVTPMVDFVQAMP